MIGRLFALALILLACPAATQLSVPAAVAPYMSDGHFDPGDYGWMRGLFDEASPAQKAEWQAVAAWRSQCHADQVAGVTADLARRGITSTADLDNINDGLCGEVGLAMRVGEQGTSWQAFRVAVARARPVAQAVIWSAALAQAEADARVADESAELIARPMSDQILRVAGFWGEGEVKGAPPLDPASHDIARALLWVAIAKRDHANTAWLKARVDRSGWPTIDLVGARASENAWLLVQHADDDPVFQLDMLKTMEPLAARGQVSERNYAMLYDRVMLQLTGKQRYGSQAYCVGGRQTVRPLENGAEVERLRRGAGLPDLADYLAGMNKRFPCPPDVIPSSPAKH